MVSDTKLSEKKERAILGTFLIAQNKAHKALSVWSNGIANIQTMLGPERRHKLFLEERWITTQRIR